MSDIQIPGTSCQLPEESEVWFYMIKAQRSEVSGRWQLVSGRWQLVSGSW